MKKSFKIIICVIVILVVIGAIVFRIKGKKTPSSKPGNMPNPSPVAGQSDTEGKKYADLVELPAEYSVQDAIQDNCVVISESTVSNKDILEEFVANVEVDKPTSVRVASIFPDGKLSLLDLVYADKIMTVSEDNTRNSFDTESANGLIRSNSYDLAERYRFQYIDSLIGNSDVLTEYSLKDMSESGDDILLFSMINHTLHTEDLKSNEFEAIVSSIEGTLMKVEPLSGTTEAELTNEIYITLENDGTFNGLSFEVEDKIRVFYDGGITRIAEMYQIEFIKRIEKE